MRTPLIHEIIASTHKKVDWPNENMFNPFLCVEALKNDRFLKILSKNFLCGKYTVLCGRSLFCVLKHTLDTYVEYFIVGVFM